MTSTDQVSDSLLTTPLNAIHRAAGARMVPFAGYDMPVHYPSGILAEHLHTRAAAGLFDVSHMGQAFLSGPNARARFESLVPGDLLALGPDRIRYTQLLNAQGGILDDLMVTHWPSDANGDERLFLVVNAARKAHDFAHIAAHLSDLTLDILDTRALLALQGPQAAAVLERLLPGVATQPFMSMRRVTHEGVALFVSRSGYTGEDGFEISLPPAQAESFAQALLADERVKLIGLGARDSLRLEAGLCLYGHDIDEETTPAEADLQAFYETRKQAFLRSYRRKSPTARRASASDSRSTARHRRARVPRLPTARAPSSGASPRAGSRPRSGGPSPWAMSKARHPRRARHSPSSCAASPCRPASSPCPSFPPATSEARDVADPLHQGS